MGMNVQQVKEGVQKFGPAVGARKIIDQEYLHASESLETGIYITYCCESKKSECSRLGSSSKCFCSHKLAGHKQQFFGKKFNTSCEQCPCKSFRFVPSRPEECGMYWLPRRKEFNVTTWRPPCKCKHTCEEHAPNYPLRCSKCNCSDFNSNFACISCDQVWELHEVIYETEHERKMLNKKIGPDYLPLSQNPDIQIEVFKQNKYQLEKYSEPEQLQQQQQNQVPKPLNHNLKPFPAKKPAPQQQQYTTQYTRQRPASLNKQLKQK